MYVYNLSIYHPLNNTPIQQHPQCQKKELEGGTLLVYCAFLHWLTNSDEIIEQESLPTTALQSAAGTKKKQRATGASSNQLRRAEHGE